MRHFRHSKLGPFRPIRLLPLGVVELTGAGASVPATRLALRARTRFLATLGTAVALPPVTRRAQEEDLVAGSLGAHDKSNGVHVVDARRRRKLDVRRAGCDTEAVESRHGRHPEGPER